MKGLADKGEREEKRRNEGQKGLGDMNPLTHITITPALAGEAATEVAAGYHTAAAPGERVGGFCVKCACTAS